MRKITLEDIRLPDDPKEKEQRIDALFDNIASNLGQNIPKGYNQNKAKTSIPATGGYQIYAVFGGGSILIDGVDQPLPVNISSKAKIDQLRAQYGITDYSALRIREIK